MAIRGKDFQSDRAVIARTPQRSQVTRDIDRSRAERHVQILQIRCTDFVVVQVHVAKAMPERRDHLVRRILFDEQIRVTYIEMES